MSEKQNLNKHRGDDYMDKTCIKIENIPAIVYGKESEKVYLFIHGKSGYKEEAEAFAEVVCLKGWQVLSIDLPEHGEREQEKGRFDPWHVVPELKEVLRYIETRWSKISLRANSIGAWFSMISFDEETFEKCLFVSPILDMVCLIENMMQWASVSMEQLEEKKEIETEFGETLSWDYLMYAKEHGISKWNSPTVILYAGKDNLTLRATVETFIKKYNCQLDVMEDGEHWFHTNEQLLVLQQWTDKNVSR